MRRCCLGVALVLSLSAQTASAERCRAIGVEVDERMEGHELSLNLVHNERQIAAGRSAVRSKLSVGDWVDVCFESSKDGFVSLWSHGANDSPPVRILPNEYIDAAADEPGIAVQAGIEKCFSDLASGKRVSLKVQKPFGRAELYLHFAEDREGQIAPGDFPSIGNKSFVLGQSCGQGGLRIQPRAQIEPYASKVLRYEVVK